MSKDGIVVLTHSVGCYNYICSWVFSGPSFEVWRYSSTLLALLDAFMVTERQPFEYEKTNTAYNFNCNVIPVNVRTEYITMFYDNEYNRANGEDL